MLDSVKDSWWCCSFEPWPSILNPGSLLTTVSCSLQCLSFCCTTKPAVTKTYLKPVAECRERLIGRCFPVVTFICRITGEEFDKDKIIHNFWKLIEYDLELLLCGLHIVHLIMYPDSDSTWEVQSVGVLGCVEFHDTSLVSVVALLDLSTRHGAGSTGINLTGTFIHTG